VERPVRDVRLQSGTQVPQVKNGEERTPTATASSPFATTQPLNWSSDPHDGSYQLATGAASTLLLREQWPLGLWLATRKYFI